MQRCFRLLVLALCSLVLLTVPAFAQSADSVLELPRHGSVHNSFAFRHGITWTTTDISQIQGTTTETNEPIHPCFGVLAANSYWYEFYVPAGDVLLSTHNSTGAASDAVMTIWTGTSITGLTPVECDDNDGIDDHAVISRHLDPGLYILQVSRASTLPAAVPGDLHVNLNFTPDGTVPSNNTFANAIPLTLPTSVTVTGIVNASASESDPASGCSGTYTPHSVWYSLTVAEDVRVGVLTTSSSGTEQRYLAILKDIGGSVYQNVFCSGDSDETAHMVNLATGSYVVALGTTLANGYTDLPDITLNLSLDLLKNGGFEEGMAPWTVVNKTNDKRKCDLDGGSNPITSYGDCAFVFKGSTGELATLIQNMPLPEGLVNTGDLTAIPYFRIKGAATTKLKMKLKMTLASGDPLKCKLTSNPADISTQFPITTTCPLPANLTKLKLSLTHVSTSGKLTLDEVSVRIEKAAGGRASSGVLPPPVAPLGFRGNT